MRLVHRHFTIDSIEFFWSLRTSHLPISKRTLSRLIAARKIAARKDGVGGIGAANWLTPGAAGLIQARAERIREPAKMTRVTQDPTM
jgi:hypothetical protein